MDGLISILVVIYLLVSLALLSRVTHWLHAIQKRLEKTNEVLELIATHQGRPADAPVAKAAARDRSNDW